MTKYYFRQFRSNPNTGFFYKKTGIVNKFLVGGPNDNTTWAGETWKDSNTPYLTWKSNESNDAFRDVEVPLHEIVALRLKGIDFKLYE